jgi:hypothetical protein
MRGRAHWTIVEWRCFFRGRPAQQSGHRPFRRRDGPLRLRARLSGQTAAGEPPRVARCCHLTRQQRGNRPITPPHSDVRRIVIAGFVPEGRWPSCHPSSAPRALRAGRRSWVLRPQNPSGSAHIIRPRVANSFPSVVAAHQALVAPAVVTDVLATAFGELPAMTVVTVTMSTTTAEVSVAAATTPTVAAGVAATVSPAPAAAAPTAASTTTTAKTTATQSATAKAGAASSTAPAASAPSASSTATASPAPMSSRMSGRGSCHRHCAHRANSHQRIYSAHRHGCRATCPAAATCVLSQHFRLLEYALSIRSRGQRSKCNVPRQKAPIDQDQAPALKVTFKRTLRLGASFRRIATLRSISAELGFSTGVNSSIPLRNLCGSVIALFSDGTTPTGICTAKISSVAEVLWRDNCLTL